MSEHSSIYHRISTVDNYNEIHMAAQRFIEERYADPITLADFLTAKGYSGRSVQRALSWHNTNWQAMLVDERMKIAKQLLEHSTESVGEIARRVNYDHSQFSRTFKAKEGKSPEDFRKELGKDN